LRNSSTNQNLKDPVKAVPTTYLIGTNGRPLNVISGVANEDEILEKLKATVNVNASKEEFYIQ